MFFLSDQTRSDQIELQTDQIRSDHSKILSDYVQIRSDQPQVRSDKIRSKWKKSNSDSDQIRFRFFRLRSTCFRPVPSITALYSFPYKNYCCSGFELTYGLSYSVMLHYRRRYNPYSVIEYYIIRYLAL